MSAQQEVERLLDQIRDRLKNDPVIERCSDQIEMLCRAQFSSTDDFLPNLHFTPAERQILDTLRGKMGKTVRKDALLDSYGWAFSDSPHPNTLSVLICRIRATLRRANAPFHIVTEQGLGYRLVDGPQPEWTGPKVSKTQYMELAA